MLIPFRGEFSKFWEDFRSTEKRRGNVFCMFVPAVLEGVLT